MIAAIGFIFVMIYIIVPFMMALDKDHKEDPLYNSRLYCFFRLSPTYRLGLWLGMDIRK